MPPVALFALLAPLVAQEFVATELVLTLVPPPAHLMALLVWLTKSVALACAREECVRVVPRASGLAKIAEKTYLVVLHILA